MTDFNQQNSGKGQIAASERERALREEVIFAIGALRSNQDLLLHKVARTLSVREQLEINRAAIHQLQEATKNGR